MSYILKEEVNGHHYLMIEGNQTECPYSGILMMPVQSQQIQQLSNEQQLVPVRYPCSSRCALFEFNPETDQSWGSATPTVTLHCTKRNISVKVEKQSSLKLT